MSLTSQVLALHQLCIALPPLHLRSEVPRLSFIDGGGKPNRVFLTLKAVGVGWCRVDFHVLFDPFRAIRQSHLITSFSWRTVLTMNQ